MRKILIVIGLLLFGQGIAFAKECPPGTNLSPIGSIYGSYTTDVDTSQVSTIGHDVRATVVSCGGTACVATVYDADPTGDSVYYVNANVKLEPGAVASTSFYQEYDPPIHFNYGIAAHDNGDVNGFLAYECK